MAIIRFTVNERGSFLKSRRQLAEVPSTAIDKIEVSIHYNRLLRHYQYTMRWCRQWSITAYSTKHFCEIPTVSPYGALNTGGGVNKFRDFL